MLTHLLVIALMIVIPFALVGISVLATYIWEKIHGR